MRKLIWMLAALLTLAPAAFAQTAQEMTNRCTFSSVGKKTLGRMADGDYRTYWASSSNGSAYVEIEAEDAIGGVYVQFYDDAAALDVQTRDASGAWQTVAQTDGTFLAAYAAVDAGAKTVRIRPKDGKGRLFIAELRVLGEGDAPPLEERVLLPGETLLYPGRWRISCESCAAGSEIQTSFNTFCFSCANICGKLSVASRAAGDTILLHRRGGGIVTGEILRIAAAAFGGGRHCYGHTDHSRIVVGQRNGNQAGSPQ